MTSSDWIAKITAMDASTVDGQLRGIRVYGRCYDERTNRLAASLGKIGKAPRANALKDFKEFETALNDFTSKALAATAPPGDAVKSAYAGLYERQFRYAFYQSYEPKPASPAPTPKPPGNAAKETPPASTAGSSASARPANTVDEMTRAKNHFGELLGGLPEDKIHEIHAAFGEILGPHPVRGATQLAVYRYAIFLLEPSSAKPSFPPPF